MSSDLPELSGTVDHMLALVRALLSTADITADGLASIAHLSSGMDHPPAVRRAVLTDPRTPPALLAELASDDIVTLDAARQVLNDPASSNEHRQRVIATLHSSRLPFLVGHSPHLDGDLITHIWRSQPRSVSLDDVVATHPATPPDVRVQAMDGALSQQGCSNQEKLHAAACQHPQHLRRWADAAPSWAYPLRAALAESATLFEQGRDPYGALLDSWQTRIARAPYSTLAHLLQVTGDAHLAQQVWARARTSTPARASLIGPLILNQPGVPADVRNDVVLLAHRQRWDVVTASATTHPELAPTWWPADLLNDIAQLARTLQDVALMPWTATIPTQVISTIGALLAGMRPDEWTTRARLHGRLAAHPNTPAWCRPVWASTCQSSLSRSWAHPWDLTLARVATLCADAGPGPFPSAAGRLLVRDLTCSERFVHATLVAAAGPVLATASWDGPSVRALLSLAPTFGGTLAELIEVTQAIGTQDVSRPRG